MSAYEIFIMVVLILGLSGSFIYAIISGWTVLYFITPLVRTFLDRWKR